MVCLKSRQLHFMWEYFYVISRILLWRYVYALHWLIGHARAFVPSLEKRLCVCQRMSFLFDCVDWHVSRLSRRIERYGMELTPNSRLSLADIFHFTELFYCFPINQFRCSSRGHANRTHETNEKRKKIDEWIYVAPGDMCMPTTSVHIQFAKKPKGSFSRLNTLPPNDKHR